MKLDDVSSCFRQDEENEEIGCGCLSIFRGSTLGVAAALVVMIVTLVFENGLFVASLTGEEATD